VSGALTAELVDGINAKLTMSFPDGYDHSFMVEQFKGTTTDSEGNEIEIWEPLHTGTRKFIQGEVDMHMCYLPEDDPDARYARVPGQRTTYRALCYRNAEPESRVLVLHTEGTYSDPVSI
jgi:hypothetical protein